MTVPSRTRGQLERLLRQKQAKLLDYHHKLELALLNYAAVQDEIFQLLIVYHGNLADIAEVKCMTNNPGCAIAWEPAGEKVLATQDKAHKMIEGLVQDTLKGIPVDVSDDVATYVAETYSTKFEDEHSG